MKEDRRIVIPRRFGVRLDGPPAEVAGVKLLLKQPNFRAPSASGGGADPEPAGTPPPPSAADAPTETPPPDATVMPPKPPQ